MTVKKYILSSYFYENNFDLAEPVKPDYWCRVFWFGFCLFVKVGIIDEFFLKLFTLFILIICEFSVLFS